MVGLLQEWWDTCTEAGPKQRVRESFGEAKPTLQLLCWKDQQTRLASLVFFVPESF